MPTPESARALARVRETASLDLDATYAAKAMAALLARCSDAPSGRRVLFWNTGNSRDLAALRPMSSPRKVPAEIQAWLVRDAIVAPGDS
jgi:1-aminocyclopropane-1-carboxylate deaminase/D-cysteine desulfhydrase-like pyridoxal-dependent ACC family enzyme